MKKIEEVFEYCRKNKIDLNLDNRIEHYTRFASDIIENYTAMMGKVSIEELVEVLKGAEEGMCDQ